MGIVAFCPQGHRVKVKEELAGKKGLCPVCGSKFRIPAAAAAPPAESSAAGAGPLPLARALSLDAAIVATLPQAVPWDDAMQVASAQPVPAAAPTARTFHPLVAERADLSWSIAYPGGEPSAPLAAAAMQDWLDGRQATGDEVVWRADWPQWMPVRDVFPECCP